MKTSFFQRSLSISFGLLCALPAFSDESYNVQLTLTPNPTTLSSSGGTVKYNRTISNLSSTPLTLNYHGLLQRPDGSLLPMTTELAMTLTALENKTQTALGYAIPSYFPAGNYTYHLYFHDAPERYTRYDFAFKKSGSNPAPTPRVNVEQTTDGIAVPEVGGKITIKAKINNTSSKTESLRYWTLLTKPDGDTKILRDPTNVTLSPLASFTLADRALELSSSSRRGNYLVATYVMSNSRNTPALIASTSIEKMGTPVSTVHFSDSSLQNCFDQQVAYHRWQYVQDVIALSCVDLGIKELHGLQQLTELQQLNLADNDITRIDEWLLPRSLKSLNVSHNRVNEVMPLNSLMQLEELRLAGNRITRADGFEYLSQLKTLDLSHNPLPGSSLQKLLQNSPGLSKVYLAGINFDNSQVLHWLGARFLLEEVDLSDTGLIINELPFSPELKVLCLANTHLQDSYLLSRFYNLQVLDIANSNTDGISGLMNFTALQELNLAGNSIRDYYGLEQLIRNNTQLKKLSIADIDLPSQWLASLFTWPNTNSQIEELDIHNTNQESLAFPFLTLKKLDISENPMRGSLYLPNANQLTSLRMANTQLAMITNSEQLLNLEVLDVSGNNFFGASMIDTLLAQNTGLREFYMRDKSLNQPLNWSGLNQLAATVRVLDLQNSVADLPAPFMPHLKVLNINNYRTLNGDSLPIGPMPRLRVLKADRLRQPMWFVDQFSDLNELSLANAEELPSNFLENIAQRHPYLRRLSLAGNNLRNVDINQVIGSVRLTLEALDLSDSQLNQQALDSLGFMPTLRELNLSRNRLDMFGFHSFPYAQNIDISYTGIHYLAAYRPFEDIALRSLNISGNELQNFSLPDMLERFKTLNTLTMNDVDLSHHDLGSLTAQMRHVKSLSIANSQSVIQGFFLPALVALDISGNTLQNSGFTAWLRELRMDNVIALQPIFLPRDNIGFKVLSIANSPIERNELMQAIHNSPMLRELNIAGHDLHNENLSQLLEYIHPETAISPLQTLNINDTGIATNGFIPLKNLRSLSLSGLGLEHMPAIERMPTELDISNNPMQDVWLPMSRHLVSLNMSGFTDLQLRNLPQMLQETPNLVTLKLANTGIQNVDLISNDRIQYLDVRGNILSSTLGLSRFQKLREIDLSSNQLLDINELGPMQMDLRKVDLSQNDNLPCTEIDRLRMTNPQLILIAPQHCELQP